jgi:exodeoxyribonuclease III
MKIITYNVNGLRSALSKGLLDWLKITNPDIICLQEIKCEQDHINEEDFSALGYEHRIWNSAEKKGYGGVAIFSKIPFTKTENGMDISDFDKEGRVIKAWFNNTLLINTYFPSGSSGEERQDVKFKFLDAYLPWATNLKNENPNLIIVGDYNIAHTELDIHDPKGNKKSSGFLPEERAWMTNWIENGFLDAFREINSDKIEYSWWSYRFNSRAKNKGWRIDYQCISPPLLPKVNAVYHDVDAVHSDHCPLIMEINI